MTFEARAKSTLIRLSFLGLLHSVLKAILARYHPRNVPMVKTLPLAYCCLISITHLKTRAACDHCLCCLTGLIVSSSTLQMLLRLVKEGANGRLLQGLPRVLVTSRQALLSHLSCLKSREAMDLNDLRDPAASLVHRVSNESSGRVS